MERTRICIVTVLAVLASAAGSRQAQPAAERCSVEGVVSSGSTGQPLGKARTVLANIDSPERTYAAVTTADGRFRVTGIPPGRYRLSVTRAGYVAMAYGQRSFGQPGRTLLLDSGRHLRDIALHMTPTSALAGRVLDGDGEPVAGVQVQAIRRAYQPDQSPFVAVGSATTNDRGEYRIWGLQPGQFFLAAVYSVAGDPVGNMVALPRTNPDAGATEESYVRTFYPGTSDSSQAGLIELGGGDDRSLADLTMIAVRTVRVQGRVINTLNAQNARGTRIQLISRTHGTGIPFVNTAVVNDDQGTFELRTVLPGSYLLLAQLNDGGRQYVARQVLDAGGSDVAGVTVIIAPGIMLTGRVSTDAGIQINPATLNIDLQARDETPMIGRPAVLVKEDGTFSIDNVPDGTFDVYVAGLPDGVYLKSARLIDRELLDAGLTVTRDQPPGGPLDITLARAEATVDGAVVDEGRRAVGGALVALVPDGGRSARTDFYQTATTDDNGRFHLTGVPPGTYRLLAWETLEPGAYRDPELLRTLERRAVRLTIQEPGRYTADLTLIVRR